MNYSTYKVFADPGGVKNSEGKFENISALDDLIKSKMLRHHDGTYGCSECEYSTKYYTTILNHIGTTFSAIRLDSTRFF